jgi:hypothetical protein
LGPEPFDNFQGNAQFGNQQEVVDSLLGSHCQKYVDNIQQNLSLKLLLLSMESNEINLFHLLISSGFDSLLEYTNESLNEKWLIPFSYGEFQKFIGTLLLSSVFNTSTEQSWNLMGSLTLNKHMSREHFVQVLTNLQRYNIRRRIIQSPNSHWTDQRNMLDHLHVLEKKNYERSIEFFFNSSYGCLVLDDKMIGSKAMDVETKIVSDR